MLHFPYHHLSWSLLHSSHRSTLSKYTCPFIFIDQSSTILIAAAPVLTLSRLIHPPLIRVHLPTRLPRWRLDKGSCRGKYLWLQLYLRLRLVCRRGQLHQLQRQRRIRSQSTRIPLAIYQTFTTPPPAAINVNNHPRVSECQCWSPLSVKMSHNPLGPHCRSHPHSFFLLVMIIARLIIHHLTRSHLPPFAQQQPQQLMSRMRPLQLMRRTSGAQLQRQQLMRRHPSIDRGEVTIISDQDKGIKSAIKEVFQSVGYFFCSWHRCKNIVLQCGGAGGQVPYSALWIFNKLSKCWLVVQWER